MSAPAISILFVDDDPDVLRAIHRALQGSPYEVICANGAGDALAVLECRPIDVLVADVDMPEMTGLELAQIARRDHPQTLRMLLTGHATLDKAVRAINDGEVVRFFAKPFDADVFRETLDGLADRIRKLRGEIEAAGRNARRQDLYRWLDSRFPGTTFVERNTIGEVVIDVLGLIAAIDATDCAEVKDLLR